MRWNTTMFGEEAGPKKSTVAIIALALAAVVIAVAAARANAQPAAPLDDPAIVAIFDLANTADIETGQLGAERAQNDEVRAYARMLADVHTAVRQQGRDLAAKLGVTPVLPPHDESAKRHEETMARLRQLRGAAFDRAFLQHEKEFHAAVLSAVKTTLLPAIRNRELKDFVTSLAPAFEAHRLAAENLQEKTAARE